MRPKHVVVLGDFGIDETSTGGPFTRSPGGSALHFTRAHLVFAPVDALLVMNTPLDAATARRQLERAGTRLQAPQVREGLSFRLKYASPPTETIAPLELRGQQASRLNDLPFAAEEIRDADYVHISTCHPGLLAESADLCKQLGKPYSMQLHAFQIAAPGFPWSVLFDSVLIFASRVEWEMIRSEIEGPNQFRRLGEGQEVVITDGDKASVMGSTEAVARMSLFTATDPTGCGDAFAGAYVALRNIGVEAEPRLRMAMAVGGLAADGWSTESVARLLESSIIDRFENDQ